MPLRIRDTSWKAQWVSFHLGGFDSRYWLSGHCSSREVTTHKAWVSVLLRQVMPITSAKPVSALGSFYATGADLTTVCHDLWPYERPIGCIRRVGEIDIIYALRGAYVVVSYCSIRLQICHRSLQFNSSNISWLSLRYTDSQISLLLRFPLKK